MDPPRPHPELLERALAIEENAKPNHTSVMGPGRSSAWADFLDDLDDTPLFDCDTRLFTPVRTTPRKPWTPTNCSNYST